jgi:hypothetical protein
VAFFIVSVLSGFLMLSLVADRIVVKQNIQMPLCLRLVGAVPVGIALSGQMTLLLAHFLGLTVWTLTLASVLLVGVPLLLLRSRLPEIGGEVWGGIRRRPNPRFLIYWLLLTTFVVFFARNIAFEKEQGIGTELIDNFADLAYHIGFITSFVQGENFPPEHPMYAGARLTYPFLVDFHAATLMVSGLRLAQALFVQNVALLLSMAGMLFAFTVRMTRRRTAGYIAPYLLFLSGGLGFLLLAPEMRESGRSFGDFLLHLPHDYSQWGETLYFGSSLVYWFGPMRGMLLGAPLMVLVWWLWQSIPAADEASQRRLLVGSGFMTGLLPLCHSHTYLCTMTVAGVFALSFGGQSCFRGAWGRQVAYYFVPAILLAVPQFILLFSQTATRPGSFIGWSWGWMATKVGLHPIPFWLLNLGLFLPLLLLALLARHRGRPIVRHRLLGFYLPFLLFFIAPNIVRFAPWEWDSIKVLFVWFVASILLVSEMVARLWHSPILGGRGVAITTFLLLTLSGGIDVFRATTGQNRWIILDQERIAFAKAVVRATPPHAVILTAPVHSSPLVLTGRIAYMNYPGFLWTNGLPYTERESEVEQIFRGEPATATAILLRTPIRYILIGPQERDWAVEKGFRLNEGYLAQFPLVAQVGNYRLHRVAFPSPITPLSQKPR